MGKMFALERIPEQSEEEEEEEEEEAADRQKVGS